MPFCFATHSSSSLKLSWSFTLCGGRSSTFSSLRALSLTKHRPSSSLQPRHRAWKRVIAARLWVSPIEGYSIACVLLTNVEGILGCFFLFGRIRIPHIKTFSYAFMYQLPFNLNALGLIE
jgi:hypothetical protein